MADPENIISEATGEELLSEATGLTLQAEAAATTPPATVEGYLVSEDTGENLTSEDTGELLFSEDAVIPPVTPPRGTAVYHHRLFDESTLLAMLSAIGRSLTINGQTVTAEFRESARNVNLYSGEVESIAPLVRCTSGQVASLGITHGTAVTVDDHTFSVIGIDEQAAGWVLLSLNEMGEAITPPVVSTYTLTAYLDGQLVEIATLRDVDSNGNITIDITWPETIQGGTL